MLVKSRCGRLGRDAIASRLFLTTTHKRRFMSTTTFAQLSVHPDMLKAIDEMGFTQTTPVQAQTIPLTRSGVDILAQSQTGTGKTMAFAIPAVERIQASTNSIQVLILSPTRELAQQCGDEIRKLSPYMPHVKTADIYGGADYKTQFRLLRGANMVIGTPGRIMDHMKRGTLKLDKLEMIVLDEADEMLNMGFKEDIETILQDAPQERQTVLFSATIPKGILDITKQFQKNPVQINLVQNKATLKAIKQIYVDVKKQHKDAALKLLIAYNKPQRAIIFANTKSMVDELVTMLSESGYAAQGIHGDMKQQQRTNVMTSFKKGKTQILIATDVAARGIDVSDIDFVFNYDIPRMSEYYVHRIGRTGRAGRSGTAITLCCGKQQVITVKRLAQKLQSDIEHVALPSIQDIRESQLQQSIQKVQAATQEGATDYAKQMIDALVAGGSSAYDIACTLADMTLKDDTANLDELPNIQSEPVLQRGERRARNDDEGSRFGKMMLNIGSSSRCSANHIIGAITERTGISSKHIGKVSIEKDHAIVAVPTDILRTVIAEMHGIKICGKPVVVTKVESRKKSKFSGASGSDFAKKPYARKRNKKRSTRQ